MPSLSTLSHSTLQVIDKIKPILTEQFPNFINATFELDNLRDLLNYPLGVTQRAIRSLIDMLTFSLAEFRIATEKYGNATEGYPSFALNSAKKRLEKCIETLQERVLALQVR